MCSHKVVSLRLPRRWTCGCCAALAVLWAAETVARFRIIFLMPFWASFGDFLFGLFFVNCLRGMLLMGEILSDELAVASVDDPGLSIGVDVPCCCCVGMGPVGADEGPGTSENCDISEGASFLAWAFPAKQNLSVLRLFLLYSRKVLLATNFIKRNLRSGGLGRLSVEIAMSLLRIMWFKGNGVECIVHDCSLWDY